MRKRQTNPYSIRLPQQLKIALQQKAEMTGIRAGTLAVFAIAQYLDPSNPNNQNPSSAAQFPLGDLRG